MTGSPQVVYTPREFPRVITILVVVSVAVNVILAAAFTGLALYGVHLGHSNASLSARIHASQVEACRQSNRVRLQDVAIWNRLLLISPAQKAAETAAQRREVTDLVHLVKIKDTPVNCAALYSGGT